MNKKTETKNKQQKNQSSGKNLKKKIENQIVNALEQDSKFIEKIKQIQSLKEFIEILGWVDASNTNAFKGDTFEIFVNWILNRHPHILDFSFSTKVKRSILHNPGIDKNESEQDVDLRKDIFKKFNLPTADEGIDGYFVTEDNKIGAYQCKWRSSETSLTLHEDKLGSFFAQTSAHPLKKADKSVARSHEFNYKVIFSTASRIPPDYNTDDFEWILRDDLAKFVEDFNQYYGYSPFLSFSYYLEGILHKQIFQSSDSKYELFPHQLEQKEKAFEHFITQNKSAGIMISPTGTGKTRMIYETVTQVFPEGIHLVAAPWIHLLYQNLEDFIKYSKARNFSFDAAISYSDSENDKQLRKSGIARLKNPEEVAVWLMDRDPSKVSILFTTYASGDKLIDGCTSLLARKPKFEFVSLTCDESHRTVGQKGSLWTRLVLPGSIPVKFKLFATATIREIGDMRKQLDDLGIDAIGMDDEAFYGNIFYSLSYKDAISKKIICDFEIVLATEAPAEIFETRRKIHLNGEEITSESLDSRQLIGLGIAHQMMASQQVTKIIFFSSDNTRSRKAFSGAKALFSPNLLGEEDILFTSHEEASKGSKVETIKAFGDASRALIFNCQQIKEGIDVKSCDCIVFLDPKTSKIDIVQAVGRALRIDPSKPNKKAKIILPVVAQIDETGESQGCIIPQETYAQLRDFLVSMCELDEEIRESFDLLIQEIPGPKSSKPKKKGKVTLVNFDCLDIRVLERIRISILKSTGEMLWYSPEEIHEIIKDDSRIVSFKVYDQLIKSGKDFREDYYLFRSYQNIVVTDFYKLIGHSKFLGLTESISLKDRLFKKIDDIINHCIEKDFSKKWFQKLFDEQFDNLFEYKYLAHEELKDRKKKNDFYINLGIKGWPITKTSKGFMKLYLKNNRDYFDRLRDDYPTEEDFVKILTEFKINTFAKYRDNYYGVHSEEFLKLGLPRPQNLENFSVYSEEFMKLYLPFKKREQISPEKIKQIYSEIIDDLNSFSFDWGKGYKKYSEKLGLNTNQLLFSFEKLRLPKLTISKFHYLPFQQIKEKLESGNYSYLKICREFKINRDQLIQFIDNSRQKGLIINYEEKNIDGFFQHNCGKTTRWLFNAEQHSQKCGCTFSKIS